MDAPTSSQQPSNKRKFLPTFIVLLLAIITALTLYFYFMFSPSQLPSGSSQNAQSRSEENENEDSVTMLQHQQQQMMQDIATLRATIPQVATTTGQMEVLYYLHLADTATTILKDVPMSLALLQKAKVKINATAELNHNAALQQAIDQDIAGLEAVQLPNFQTLAQSISALEQTALTLPFKDEVQPKAPPAPTQAATSLWQSVWENIATVLQYVVRVNRSDTGATPYFLFPEQKTLLREQIRVQLEQLLLAAMAHDTLLYQSKLKEIENSINYFFAVDQEQVVMFSQQLEALGQEVIVPVLPAANHALLLLEQMG